MRLGEIKQIIDQVMDDNSQIVIDHTALYGGQANLVNNFQQFVEVYDLISDLEWNDVDNAQLKSVIEKYRETGDAVRLEEAEFSLLNTYISAVNQKMPYYYSILKGLVGEQDELAINIKLPEDVSSLEELSVLNSRLQKTLDLFNIDGEFTFEDFDKGSAWYVVCAQGLLTSTFFLACLKIAQEVMKLRSEYFKSEEAKISYEAAKAKTNKDLTTDAFQKSWIEVYMDTKVKEIIDAVNDKNGATRAELQTKLIKGTTKLVKELGEGVEFHLSLNPPDYVSKTNGGMVIDYKKIREIRAEEAQKLGKDKTKQLPAPVPLEIEQAESANESKK